MKHTGNTDSKQQHPDLISRLPINQRKQVAECRYAAAVEMYASTKLTISKISEICNVSASGLSSHLGRYHRSLLFARYGLDPDSSDTGTIKVKPRRGQSIQCHLKYKDAIEACADLSYIEYNVSQIARLFDLNGTSLASQLRAHYPSIIENREKLRQKLGIADNIPRGPRKYSKETYANALEMYRDTDMSIPEVADVCNVSLSGLTQFMRFYHKEIIDAKATRRSKAKKKIGMRTPGQLAGNGNKYGPKPETIALYSKALELYRTTSMTTREIATAANVTYEGFCGYLHQWHRGDKLRRRGYEWDGTSEPNLKDTRQYRKSTAAKYAAAIASLKDRPRAVASVAAEFGHNPDIFRKYLKTHEPKLAASLGMSRDANGKLVKISSVEKYGKAVQEYATSTESLKTIARRHGIVYNSLCNYITRNCQEERKKHQYIVDQSVKKDKQ